MAVPITGGENWKREGTLEATHFGTLGDLYKEHLVSLLKKRRASEGESDLLLASYQLLARRIRNRDAHAYVPNVRDDHHELVPNLFCDCFNLLITWLPEGTETLVAWRAHNKEFVDEIS